MNPKERIDYIKKEAHDRSLIFDKENALGAYCPISLTSTPSDIKHVIKDRQVLLMDILRRSGIDSYDPGSAPFSPDLNRDDPPSVIYRVDIRRILEARFFVGHNLIASSGFGTEMEAAARYVRMGIILHDKNIRVSRMIPNGLICLEYSNFTQQQNEFKDLFDYLKDIEIGLGRVGDETKLIGFNKNNSKPYDIEKNVYKLFPQLKYTYDGDKPIPFFKTENIEIFSK